MVGCAKHKKNLLSKSTRDPVFFCMHLILSLVIISCGSASKFISISFSEAVSRPVVSPTVLPPVPVVGSYLTLMALDERSAPIPNVAAVFADGKYSGMSDSRGQIQVPMGIVQSDYLDVDFNKGSLVLPARLHFPPDLVAKARSQANAQGADFDRALAVVLPAELAMPGQSPIFGQVQRFPTVTMSLPKDIVSKVLQNVPVFKLEVSSPKNIDVVTNPIGLSGICTPGFRIRLKGDVDQNREELCIEKNGQGNFNFDFHLIGLSGFKQIVLEQVEPNSGVYISLLINVFSDLSSTPVVSIVSPTSQSGTFAINSDVDIEWSCSSLSGLDPKPVRLSYTPDDGLSFVDVSDGWVSNNLSQTSGRYSWKLPSNLQAFRLRVECRTPAGVVTTRMSDFLNNSNWSIYAGNPGSLHENISAQAAIMTDRRRTWQTLAVDVAGNIFLQKESAIMKIESRTGVVTRFAGEARLSHVCTLQAGSDPMTSSFNKLGNGIVILGTNKSSDAIIFVACNKIWLLNTLTRNLTLLNSTAPPSILNGEHFLSRSKNLYYFRSGQLFKLNLTTPEQQPEPIVGVSGVCSGTAPTKGSRALDFPMLARVNNSTGAGDCTAELRTFASPDESKVWVGCRTGNVGYSCRNYVRYDFDAQRNTYVVGAENSEIPSSWEWSNCVPSYVSSRVWCSSRWSTGERLSYDTKTGQFIRKPFGFNDFVRYAPGPGGMVSFQSNNILRAHLEKSDGTVRDVVIGGKDIETYGDGASVSDAAFSGVDDITFSPDRNLLLVLTPGAVRRIDTSTNKAIPGQFSGEWRKRVTLNKAGDKLLAWFNCGGLFNFLYNFDGTTFSKAPVMIQSMNTCGYDIGNMAYPPADGSPSNTPVAWPYSGHNLHLNRRPLAHTNGKVYFFSVGNDNKNALIYSSGNRTLNIVAGKLASGSGYSATDNRQPAFGALLSDVRVIFEIPAGKPHAGDLLIVDNNRLRRVSVKTEESAPKIYDVVALSLAPEYTAAGVNTTGNDFMDAVYDFKSEQIGPTGPLLGSGSFYYSWKSHRVSKFRVTQTSGIDLVAATDTPYNFSGTSLNGNNTRLALTPAGLLVTQPDKARILSVIP